jgi:hypothetical protein
MEELIPLLLKLFNKVQKEGTLSNTLYKDSITLIKSQVKTCNKKKVIGQYP